MKLPYTRLVQEVNDESGHYFYGRVLELDGCQSTGDTLEELYEGLNEAMEGYFKDWEDIQKQNRPDSQIVQTIKKNQESCPSCQPKGPQQSLSEIGR